MHVARAIKILRVLQELGLEKPDAGPTPHIWSPQTPTAKQREFLSLGCLEALFGGAAGPGKSSALLIAALEHVHIPGYAAMLMRKTYRDLALPGALMDRAAAWLRPTAARWREVDKQWVFPSGATLTFGYLDADADKYRYQGSEIQFLGIDELTQWTEAKYLYMTSRVRRPLGSPIPLRIRSASNPGGIGHDWVMKRFVDPHEHSERVFVPARLEDNPHLDQAAYKVSLELLDNLTRRQLLLGEWVTDAKGLIYPINVSNPVSELPQGAWDYILAVDLGASMTRPTTAFQIAACSKRSPFVYLVESEQHAMGSPGAVAEQIHRYMERYDLMTIAVDQGGLGRGYIEEFTNRYHIPAEEGQNRNKLGYRRLMRGDIERGMVKVVQRANTGLLAEWGKLRWNEAETDCEKHAQDHASDAALYAYVKAYHYLHQPEPDRPAPGTPEAIEAELDAMADEEAAAIGDASEPGW